ncbi:la-related protein 4B-like, partial [Carlito syrichta]|uniref:La-related protein 4B-like n=1 Tax=Carlito syrichta TaxID=1868482 RepID=A0A1U7T3X3_CARSF
MTSDQDAKVVAEPQTQRVQEGKDSSHLMNGPISQTTSQTSSIPALSQVPTTKVSELNPNAKVWGTHVLHLEASSTADHVSAAWEEASGHHADHSRQGSEASGDGDKSRENAALPDVQEPDQADMIQPLALDHSEYESLPENSET